MWPPESRARFQQREDKDAPFGAPLLPVNFRLLPVNFRLLPFNFCLASWLRLMTALSPALHAG